MIRGLVLALCAGAIGFGMGRSFSSVEKHQGLVESYGREKITLCGDDASILIEDKFDFDYAYASVNQIKGGSSISNLTVNCGVEKKYGMEVK